MEVRIVSGNNEHQTYLHITRSPIEVEVKIFDFPVLREFVHNVLLCCFLVHIGYQYNPSFNRCYMIRMFSVSQSLSGQVCSAYSAQLVSPMRVWILLCQTFVPRPRHSHFPLRSVANHQSVATTHTSATAYLQSFESLYPCV